MLFRSSALFLALASSAHAFVFIGNPKLHLEVSRAEADLTGGDAYVDLVRVHACGGGYTDYAVEQWVDPTDGWDTTIAGGDSWMWCWVSSSARHSPRNARQYRRVM